MLDSQNNFILADGRWYGQHGIGRFAQEVLSRLSHTDILQNHSKPLSIKGLLWQTAQLAQHKTTHKVFFTPGFNPVLYSPLPYVMTIHDLIHLNLPSGYKHLKRWYYNTLIKPAARKASKIITSSDFSKQTILDWAGLPESQVINVSCGISENMNNQGEKYLPGYPYLLHIGNTRPHKNVARLLQAFALAKIDPEIRLVLTGKQTSELLAIIEKNHLQKRIVWSGSIPEKDLPSYYRGALALVFPSLYEGFGLPPLEAMACGTPALTSNTTSLLEITGNAALLVDPSEIDSIREGIEVIAQNNQTRTQLITQGLIQAREFSWEKTAQTTQKVLDAMH